jgi:hypothetical protein
VQQLTHSVGAARFHRIGERGLGASGDGVSGLITRLLKTWGAREATPMEELLKEWQKPLGTAVAQAKAWFGRLNGGTERGAGDGRRRYRTDAELRQVCPLPPDDLLAAVKAAVKPGTRLVEALSEAAVGSPDPATTAEGVAELAGVLKEWEEIRETLEQVLEPEGAGAADVCWKEWTGADSFNLVSAPADVSGPLGKSLNERYERLVLTSATLSVAGEFDHLLRRWGLSAQTPTLSLTSPFDFGAAVCLLAITDAPDPREAAYADFLANTLEQLVATTRRKLALFYALEAGGGWCSRCQAGIEAWPGRDGAAHAAAPLPGAGRRAPARHGLFWEGRTCRATSWSCSYHAAALPGAKLSAGEWGEALKEAGMIRHALSVREAALPAGGRSMIARPTGAWWRCSIRDLKSAGRAPARAAHAGRAAATRDMARRGPGLAEDPPTIWFPGGGG